MNGKELKEKLISYSKSNGIDLLGFASKDRFDGLDARYNPFSIFPEGKTVILVGKRICRGSFRGVEEGSNFLDFDLFGSTWLDDEFVAIACYDITRQIEDEGFEAVPVYNNPSEVFGMGVPVAKGKLPPNVAPDFNYAFVACGLGELSYIGIPLSKEYGSRQRLQMVITDAEIPSDPVSSEKICDHCMKCADACPLGAISKTEFEHITICGKTMKAAKINYELCRKCKNGCIPNKIIKSARPNLIPALCNRVCLSHLEDSGLVSGKFANSFRKRAAWAIDINDKQMEIEK